MGKALKLVGKALFADFWAYAHEFLGRRAYAHEFLGLCPRIFGPLNSWAEAKNLWVNP